MSLQNSQFLGKPLNEIFNCNIKNKKKLYISYYTLLNSTFLKQEKSVIEILYKIAQHEESSKHYNIDPKSNFLTACTILFESLESTKKQFELEQVFKATCINSLMNYKKNTITSLQMNPSNKYLQSKESKDIKHSKTNGVLLENNKKGTVPNVNKEAKCDELQITFNDFDLTEQETSNCFVRHLIEAIVDESLDKTLAIKLQKALNLIIYSVNNRKSNTKTNLKAEVKKFEQTTLRTTRSTKKKPYIDKKERTLRPKFQNLTNQNKLGEIQQNKNKEKRRRICDTCEKTFASASTLSRHKKLHKTSYPFSCKCSRRFTRRDEFLNHINREKSLEHQPIKGKSFRKL